MRHEVGQKRTKVGKRKEKERERKKERKRCNLYVSPNESVKIRRLINARLRKEFETGIISASSVFQLYEIDTIIENLNWPKLRRENLDFVP